MRKRKSRNQEADLDITSFMNLMIILVPVLLMTMVLSQITVLDIVLPELGGKSGDPDKKKPLILEVVIEPDQMIVSSGTTSPKTLSPVAPPIKKIVTDEGEEVYDYKQLQEILKAVKAKLTTQGVEKKDILVLSQPDTDYQTIIRTMDTVRSFKTVQGVSVVDAALFPLVSLGDAPPLTQRRGQ